MASAAGVAGVRATLDLGSKSSKCVQCGEPDSARITHQQELGQRWMAVGGQLPVWRQSGNKLAIHLRRELPPIVVAIRGIVSTLFATGASSYDPASARFISAANFGQRGLARSGSQIALCRNAATMECRSSIAFSNQFAARSISPQQVWKIAKPIGTP